VSSSRPSIAIVVSTRGRGAKIAGLLDSLVAINNPDVEMVIVDQSDADDTQSAVQAYLSDSRIRYIRSDSVGVSRGRNLGLRHTSAPFVCITDDDCMVPCDWPERMCEPFFDDRVGVVWCSVVPAEPGAAGHTPHKVFQQDTMVRDVKAAWRRAESGFNLGAGLAIRRSAFDDVSGFDELLGPGSAFPAAEDNDLAWRCLLRGWRVLELSTVQVVHDGLRTSEDLRKLTQRDFRGVGGACSKYIRVRRWKVFRLLLVWTFRFGVVDPAKDLIAGRRPRGFRRPVAMWTGVKDGLSTPLDHVSMRFAGPSTQD
jgi:GT2 family glycosyltransferase